MSGEHSDRLQFLNPYQRESLTTTMSLLEEMLFEIDRTLACGGYKGVVFGLRDDISSSAKEGVLKRISLARKRIEAVAERFVLGKRSKEASRDFMGKLAYGKEILEGAKATYLRGYGPVSEGLAGSLDPQLDGILFLVNEMQVLITGQKKE